LPSASERLTLLDACAVINLYATERIAEIVECIEGRVGIASIVRGEALYVAGPEELEDREIIDLSELADTGLIEILSPETDGELYSFLDFAIDLDDGEAMTLALAMHRDAVVVTDDRKAIQLAGDSIATVPSLETIKVWFETQEISAEQQRDILGAVQTRASYTPGRNHPLRNWWDRILDQP
jgi:predicted nucleic acid-binding protein